jgi:hypothetical protein
MKILNVHTRVINQPKAKINELLKTLATDNDLILATDKWPPMKLNEGLKEGSRGGHGPIRYTVQKFIPYEFIQFEFVKPSGFNGIHKFEINALEEFKTEIKHTISMNAQGIAILTWSLAIRWLHDAYIEDAFDKTENYFLLKKKKTTWSIWVKVLRALLK